MGALTQGDPLGLNFVATANLSAFRCPTGDGAAGGRRMLSLPDRRDPRAPAAYRAGAVSNDVSHTDLVS